MKRKILEHFLTGLRHAVPLTHRDLFLWLIILCVIGIAKIAGLVSDKLTVALAAGPLFITVCQLYHQGAFARGWITVSALGCGIIGVLAVAQPETEYLFPLLVVFTILLSYVGGVVGETLSERRQPCS